MKVYLADTDAKALGRMANILHRAGFGCEKVSITSSFHDFASHHPEPDIQGVFLLGATLSDRSKKTWIDGLKSRYPRLAILAVAEPARTDAILALLRKGVDDWISPSAHAREIIARVGLLFQRKYPDHVVAGTLQAPPYVFTSFPARVFREGQEIFLTAKEYETAFFLFSHIGQTLSRQRICESIWKCPLDEASRTVDIHISRVRNRLGLKDGTYGYVLEQLYGYGYLLRRL